ncbi:MAG TPA: hypothetical protein ENJ34_03460 [Epsilonproteobacteria bacterium]|nr:hypothetical protein [Campylobacterota bacterium]
MNSSTKDTYMKHTLGSLLLFVALLCVSLLQAEDFRYTMHANKQTAYLHEPILLTVDINQTNPDTVLLFQFAPRPSDAYKVIQVHAKHDDTSHHVKYHNLYEIYPLKTGDVNVTFSLTKRVTDEDKVRYFASGDRDDFKKLETKDYPIAIPPLALHIKPLPKDVSLVGDFSLDYKIHTHTQKAFSPISWKITLKGKGYTPIIKHIIPLSSNYKSFSEKPLVKTIPSPEGMINTVTYLFALSARQSYVVPSITLKAFSPSRQKTYTLEIPQQSFDIQSVDKEQLVDNIDMPALRKADWTWIETFLKYLLVFTAGYFTALSLRWKKKKMVHASHPLVEKISQTKTHKQLLQLLMAHEEGKHFSLIIEKLEASLYGTEKTNLNTLKKEALENLK